MQVTLYHCKNSSATTPGARVLKKLKASWQDYRYEFDVRIVQPGLFRANGSRPDCDVDAVDDGIALKSGHCARHRQIFKLIRCGRPDGLHRSEEIVRNLHRPGADPVTVGWPANRSKTIDYRPAALT